MSRTPAYRFAKTRRPRHASVPPWTARAIEGDCRMTQTSHHLGLPYLLPSQAQKHVTHNEAIAMLDALVHLAVNSRTVADPPATPLEGMRFIVADGATGAWADRTGALAVFDAGGWRFQSPEAGWIAYVVDAGTLEVFDGAVWQNAAAGAADRVGINTPPSPVHRLSVAGASVLLNHEGSDQRLILNKASASDTASVVYQTAFSARAETGLTGSQAWALKVSDGAAWRTSILADPATGRVAFPSGGVREALAADRDYHVDPSDGDDAGAGRGPGTGAFRTLARALAELHRIDAAGHRVTVRLASGRHTLASPVFIGASVPGLGELVIRGESGTILAGPGDLVQVAAGRAILESIAFQPGRSAIVVGAGGVAACRDCTFALGSGPAIDVAGGAATIGGTSVVSGGGPGIALVRDGGALDASDGTIRAEPGTTFDDAGIVAEGCAVVRLTRTDFDGSASGARHRLAANAALDLGGRPASNLPGSVAGSKTTGAVIF